MTVSLTNGVDFGAGGLSTVNGLCSSTEAATCNTDAANYGSSSTLKYDTGGAYGRLRRNGAPTSNQRYPYNVRASKASS